MINSPSIPPPLTHRGHSSLTNQPPATHGGGYSAGDDDDLRGAATHAANNAPEDQDFFSGILSQLIKKKQQGEVEQDDIDEDGAWPFHIIALSLQVNQAENILIDIHIP
jgi:hypothetical protein